MAGESTPLRGVTSDSAAAQRKTRLAAIAGVAVVAAVAIGFWATSGGSSSSNANVGSAAGSGSSPQVAPLSVTPLPTTEAPVPATKAPVPTTVAPAPVPTTEKPVPTTEKPAPTTEKPAPTTEKPAPTTEKPAPTTEKPAPATEKPAPTTEKPEPTTDKPAETTEKPAPTSVKPEPATDKPVSATEKPEPTSSQPKVTTAAPVAATTVPSVAPAVSSVAPVPVVAPTTTKAPTPISVHDVTCGIANTEAGYIQLPNKKNDNYFYWYYESRASPSTDPLVVWLTGGPGCSSIMALLSENGPCTVQPNLTTQLNPYSWNSHANVIWLDQPSNVGYSYSTEADDADKDEDDVGDNFFWFLNGFLDKHPELEGRDLYITGESYAGHYVPAAAHKIWQQTKIIKEAGTPVRINLKGIAIGNGLTNPEIQMQHQLDMVNNTYNVTLMSPEDYAHAKEMIPKCTAIVKDILAGGNFTLTDDKLVECQLVLEPFKKASRNPYDIRLPCGDVADATQCYDMTYISEYLNSDAVRKYLNVTSPKPWLECDASVGLNFMKSGDVAINYESYVADLLNDGSVRVLLYVGDADTVCNWYGNKAWATALEWTHKAEFNAAEDHAFVTGNGLVQAGVAKAYSNQFTFLRLFNSGHMVPRDQPAVALEMIEKFFRGETF